MILGKTNLGDTRSVSLVCKQWQKATTLQTFWRCKFVQRVAPYLSHVYYEQIDLWNFPHLTLRDKFEWMFYVRFKISTNIGDIIVLCLGASFFCDFDNDYKLTEIIFTKGGRMIYKSGHHRGGQKK